MYLAARQMACGSLLLVFVVSGAVAQAQDDQIALGKGIGKFTIGMEWSAAERLIHAGHLGASGTEDEDLYGHVIRTTSGVVGDYAFAFDDPPSEPSISTPGRVAYIGTSDRRFRLVTPKGVPIRVGSQIDDLVAAYGQPDGRREKGWAWMKLGLEIEPTLQGKGNRIGWIGVFLPSPGRLKRR